MTTNDQRSSQAGAVFTRSRDSGIVGVMQVREVGSGEGAVVLLGHGTPAPMLAEPGDETITAGQARIEGAGAR